MTGKRRTYTDEFKREALRLVSEEGYTLAEAGRRLGISGNLLTRWRQSLAAEGESESSGTGKSVSLDEENRRLREENRRLRMEREILKKAAAFFANEKP